MNEKLNIQDLSNALSQRCGIGKGKTDEFVRDFFELIETSLGKDQYAKIKRLGVFKLIKVEPRESINIQTKERFEIPGYTKISFTPDQSLKELVNKPFSHFETVPLNEHVTFDGMPGESAKETGNAFEHSTNLSRKPKFRFRYIVILIVILFLLCLIAVIIY